MSGGVLFEKYEQLAAADEARKFKQNAEASGTVMRTQHLSDALLNSITRLSGQDPDAFENRTGNILTNASIASSSRAARRNAGKRWVGADIGDQLRRSIALCESPIERSLLPFLVYADYGDCFSTYPAPIFFHKEKGPFPTCDVFIVPQFAFVRYRADFAIVAKCNGQVKIVAVECDGEEFHTAKHDTLKDGLFASFGIETIRANGSEVTQHGDRVADRAAARIREWAEALQ